MPIDVVVKANRILSLLGLIFKAHVDLVNNTVGDKLYATALIDITNQSLGLATYTLALHALVKDVEDKEFKEGLKTALRFVERYKEIQNVESTPNNVRVAVDEACSLILDLKEAVVLI